MRKVKQIMFITMVIGSLLYVLGPVMLGKRATKVIEKMEKPQQEYKIPNTVHYIWYHQERRDLAYYQMLSILSANKYLTPDAILFHTNMTPAGPHWDRVSALPVFRVIPRNPNRSMYGTEVKTGPYVTSDSDVDRLLVLTEHGGIFLDLDVLVIKSMDPLRKYDFVVGYKLPGRICGGIALGAKSSAFLYLWLNHFINDYRTNTWAYNSGTVPSKLAEQYPHLVHTESQTLHQPNCKELHKIWGSEEYDWSENYAMHLWEQKYLKQTSYHAAWSDETVRVHNCTFAKVARAILFD